LLLFFNQQIAIELYKAYQHSLNSAISNNTRQRQQQKSPTVSPR